VDYAVRLAAAAKRAAAMEKIHLEYLELMETLVRHGGYRPMMAR
jgi:hypothetical protein